MTKADQLLAIMTTNFEFTVEQEAMAFDTLTALAAELGADVVRSRDDTLYPFGWNGKTIRIDSTTRGAFDLAHEIGHYMLAAPQRRNLMEFGLGAGFSTSGLAEQIVSDQISQYEEDCACVLAAILLHSVGLPNLSESELVQFVCEQDGNVEWFTMWEADTKVPGIVEQLIGWGLIENDLTPIRALRIDEIDPV